MLGEKRCRISKSIWFEETMTSSPGILGPNPGLSLKEKNGSSLRSPCFLVGKNRIILPAFGSFTGIRKIKPVRDDRIFMTNGQEVIEVPTY